jgi:ssDNA-binding Zn-finger/Zn-ribbon topoisomerase 1
MINLLTKPKKWWFAENSEKKIRCDNSGCNWTHKMNSYDELFDWLNVKCPKCNGTLPIITKEDLNSMLFLNKIIGNPLIRFINWIGGKLRFKKTIYRTVWSRKGDGKFTLVDTSNDQNT